MERGRVHFRLTICHFLMLGGVMSAGDSKVAPPK